MTAIVLVADDSPVIRGAVRSALAATGYAVVEAVDGQDALRACEDSRPDVVLLDVEMPNLDGFQTLRRLKANEDLADIPVVFLTGRTDSADVVAALGDGAHDYLRKPFEAHELVARVSAAARVKWLQDQLRARNAELSQLARLDQLTNLPNRRHLEEALAAAASLSSRSGGTLGVLLVDVDHFKHINDGHGHEAGDAVLQELAMRMRSTARQGDLVGRWGGEEFLVVLPQARTGDAEMAAERLRMAVAAWAFPLPTGAELQVTVSVGGAVGPGHAVQALLGEADAALYEAKAAGRNLVCVRPAA